jgi:hypothetical protein
MGESGETGLYHTEGEREMGESGERGLYHTEGESESLHLMKVGVGMMCQCVLVQSMTSQGNT